MKAQDLRCLCELENVHFCAVALWDWRASPLCVPGGAAAVKTSMGAGAANLQRSSSSQCRGSSSPLLSSDKVVDFPVRTM